MIAPTIYKASSFKQEAGRACPHRGVKETLKGKLVADPCSRKTDSSGYCVVHSYVLTYLSDARIIGFPQLQVNDSLWIEAGQINHEGFAETLTGPGSKPYQALFSEPGHVPADRYQQVMAAIKKYSSEKEL